MSAPAQLTDDYHLSLSIGKALWDDLVGAALPLKVRDGTFDLTKAVYRGVKQLGVRQRVRALLEDRNHRMRRCGSRTERPRSGPSAGTRSTG